jgi:hypothetical protein
MAAVCLQYIRQIFQDSGSKIELGAKKPVYRELADARFARDVIQQRAGIAMREEGLRRAMDDALAPGVLRNRVFAGVRFHSRLGRTSIVREIISFVEW